MPLLKQRPPLVRLIAAVLCATVLQACASWQARSLVPAHFSTSAHPGSARLTLVDGSRVVVLNPVIRGDSLYGTRPGSTPSPVAFALTDIRGVAVGQTNEGGTMLMVVGVGLAAALILFVAAACSGDSYVC